LEESKLFDQFWPWLKWGYSFPFKKTHIEDVECTPPPAQKDWVKTARCMQCNRRFDKREQDDHVKYCGRHKVFQEQMGINDKIPSKPSDVGYLFNYWLIYMLGTNLYLCPSSCFIWDLLDGLLLAVILVGSVCLYSYIIWCIFYKPAAPRKKTYEEQLGIRLPSFITPDFLARETTLFIALQTSIMSSSNKAGVIAALVSFAQAHSQKSLIGHLKSFASSEADRDWMEIIGGDVTTMVEQSGEDEDKWLIDLKETLTDWRRHRENKDVKNFLKLLNYAVSVGMCEKASLTFKMGKLTVFEPIVYKQQVNCLDMADLVCTTAIGFIEGGWRVYKSGECTAFFKHDADMQDFEDKYNRIRDIHGYSLTGNLQEYAEIAETDYEVLMDDVIKLGDRIVKLIVGKMTVEKKFMMDRLDRLRDWRNEFVQVRCRGGLRKSPFAISYFGNTCVGKSTLNILSYHAIGRYNDIDVSDERVATWADNDKYASNIRSSTNVIIFDDFGNTCSKFMDFSPVYRLIQTINNALFLAPMAEAFMKGKVALHPWLVTVTTNVEHLLCEQYSNKPESVLRRLYHVKVVVRPEFLTDGKLDSDKVEAVYGMKRDADIWKLSVRHCVVGAAKTEGSGKNHYALSPIYYKGERMVDIDVNTYLEWAQTASKKHFKYQAKLVEKHNKNGDDGKLCNDCGFAFCSCKKKKEEEETCLPPHVDDNVHPDDDSVVGELNELCHGLRTMLGVDGEFEEQASPALRTIIRSVLWYCAGYIFGLLINIFIILCRLPAESRYPFVRFYAAWANNHFIAWRTKLRRASMWNLYRFARWQLQQRWNIRAFFWRLSETRTEDLINLDNWYNDSIFDWVAWVPDSVVQTPWLTYTVLYARRYEILDRKWKVILIYAFCMHGSGWLLFKGCYISALIVFYSIMVSTAVILYYEKRAVKQELLQRNRALPAYIRIFKEHSGKVLLGSSLFGAYFILKWIYGMKKTFTTHGNLNPQTMEDVKERDEEPNVWAQHYVSPLPMTTQSKTTTPHDLANKCAENLVFVQSHDYHIRGFMIESNFMILPTHFLARHWREGKEDFEVRCLRKNPHVTGGNFREMISKAYTYSIPETDFTLCWTPSSGSMADMRKFLPLAHPGDAEATLITKSKIGEIEFTKTYYRREALGVNHTSMRNMKGGVYNLPWDTQQGMCMSTLVSRGRGSMILGFHLAGEGTVGVMCSVTFDQIEKGLKELAQVPGVVRTASQGIFPEEQAGTQTVEKGDVHRKSATRFLSEGCSIEVYGPTSGRATPHSSVVPTVISDHVHEITGVPQKWGPPKMKGVGVYPYQVALEQLSHPSLSLGSVLVKAVTCYRMQFIKIRTKLPELFTECKPLTQVQTVSGIAGRRFIDAMNFSTSPGWPRSGKKSKLLIDLEPDDYPDVGNPRTFIPEIWEEVDHIKKCMLKSERAYCVWKACLKDEPTSVTKDKVRVFQSAPLALQLLIRMYFLPIVRIIQMNPLLTECLVGANAEGPEWEQLNEFMVSKGKNVLAGDYSKYDQRMPAQMVTAAFSVLIWVAEYLSEYSCEDVAVMKALIAEIVYPVMSYNGDMIMLFGSNPSGQNLTVIINSIVNSLLLRSCYYTKYPEDKMGTFTGHCAFGTYGDDVKGTVSETKPLFNHISFAEFLSKFDMKFTMPDKESVATEYMDAAEADFLKRRNYYNEDLQANVGVLAEDSIFKRLHAHLLSKELSLEQQSAQNIDTSLHDWFYYGREKFEERKQQMQEVAQQAGITHMCRGFDKSYDMRVQHWLQKYRPEDADDIECGAPHTFRVDY
jgi:hypothetical protein